MTPFAAKVAMRFGYRLDKNPQFLKSRKAWFIQYVRIEKAQTFMPDHADTAHTPLTKQSIRFSGVFPKSSLTGAAGDKKWRE
ncbi:MAG TPA: hypothetical protein VGO67_13230 [Verrucomicrobiae bacterium]